MTQALSPSSITPADANWLFESGSDTDSPALQQKFSQALGQLFQNTRPAPEIAEHIQRLTHPLANSLWPLKERLYNQQEPLVQFAALLFYHTARWQANRGRIGKEFPGLLKVFINQIGIGETLPEPHIKSFCSTLNDYHQQHSQRVQALEERQITAEQNSSLAKAAKQATVAEINERLHRRQLPHWLTEFIHQRLVYDLTAVRMRNADHPTLTQWLSLLESISWVFGSDQHTEAEYQAYQQRLYNDIPNLLDTLDQRFLEGIAEPQFYQALLARLQNALVECIKLTPEQTQTYQPLCDEKSSSVKLVATAEQSTANSHDLGSWFWSKDPEFGTKPRKLYFHDPNTETLYFSDYWGKQDSSYPSAQFNLLIASKMALKIPSFEQQLHKLLSALSRHAQEQARLQALAAQPEQLPSSESSPTKPVSNAEKPDSNRAQSVNKINHELNQLAQDGTTTSPASGAQPQATSGIVKSDTEIAQFSQKMASLPLGAWLEFSNEKEKQQKLTLKLPSSDKYLFTDRLGRKMGEYRFGQLLDLFATGQLSITDAGEQFDSRLEHIVRGQRRK